MTKTSPLAFALVAVLSACAAPAEPERDARPDPAQSAVGSGAKAGTAAPRASGPAAEQRFFDWTALATAPGAGKLRRDRLADALTTAGGGVFLAPSRPARSGGETFRQLDDFMYFTGLELPDSVLAIDAEARTAVLFAPARDARFESASRPNDFPGRKLADDPELERVAGIRVRPIADLERAMATWRADERRLWIDVGPAEPGGPGESGDSVAEPATAWVREYSVEEGLVLHVRRKYPQFEIRNAFTAIAKLRMIKSEAEIAVLRRSIDVTVRGIRHAAGFVGPGVDERTLEAELEAELKRLGSQRLAFDSIIKSGPNSLWPWRILASHYDRRNREMQSGELVIFDVGCELEGYASDVGRTFPVSGRFTPRQRELLELEVAVADAILAAIRPGATFAKLTEAAVAAMPEDARRYMQTGLFFGHHIGLAVGDPSLTDAVLEPGMVFTVEPWYYNHDEGIAVFTEDVVLVTPNGCEVLTSALPRDPDSLERMLRRR
jgi:Xaa-Pro aminopeptidase